MRIGMLCSRIRQEEKLLLKAFEQAGVDVLRIDDRDMYFRLDQDVFFPECALIFDRSINYSHALYLLKLLNNRGMPTINSYDVVKRCGDKFATSLALEQASVPTPKVKIAFTPEAALEAVEMLGYPAVVKPAVGSWGRLIAKIENRSMAEAIFEHKATLGTYHHSIFYLQEHVEKPGRDIRVFVIDNEVIAAIYRTSEHWITNTARGGKASNCPITPEIRDISLKTYEAMGGGILAIDLFESDKGLLVNEVNHTMEFRNSITTTGVDIPALMVEYVCKQAKQSKKSKP